MMPSKVTEQKELESAPGKGNFMTFCTFESLSPHAAMSASHFRDRLVKADLFI
jgi:hypothetical protein